MPVRLDPPDGPDYEIYRSFAHGDLVRFHVLDTRQYRADQQRSAPFVEQLGDAVQVRDETLANDLDQTMLGAEQRSWLIDERRRVERGLGRARAAGVHVRRQRRRRSSTAGRRRRHLGRLRRRPSGGARRARHERRQPGRADRRLPLGGRRRAPRRPVRRDLPVVGTEFMASSISSSFFDDDADGREPSHRCPDRQSAAEVVRRPARLHRVRGHPRPVARHVSRRRRPVRRGITRQRPRLVGGREPAYPGVVEVS